MHTRASATLAAAATTAALVMVTGACTSGAPVASPGGTARTVADDRRLFPLVRDASSDGGATARRVGFVDESGRVVVRPIYRAHLVCPGDDGTEVLLAWGSGHLDALDDEGETISTLAVAGTSTPDAVSSDAVSTVACGPLPGYLTVGAGQTLTVVTLPDLTGSDLPVGVALDASVIWVPATGQGGSATAPYLYDATSATTTALPSDVASLVLTDEEHPAGTGEWPVPARDTKGKQRYLDKTGSWTSTQTFAQAGAFVDGHGWVSTGASSWYFVDATLTKTGRDWTSIVPVLAADGAVTGYQVTTTAGGTSTGLVSTDLKVVVDPAAESAQCADTAGSTASAACVARAADGTARLVLLPAGTSTPLPQGMTTPLSDRLVTNGAGSVVHNLTTGQSFGIPAPYRAEAGWADAYVVVMSDNGLRMVLDGAGAATGLGTITGQVTAADGTAYFWASTRSRQGYVDVVGDWLYDEARYQALED